MASGTIVVALLFVAAPAPPSLFPSDIPPLTWATSEADLRRACPSATVESSVVPGPDGRSIRYISAEPIQTRFGPLLIQVLKPIGDGPATSIMVTGSELRPECRLETTSAADAAARRCRNAYGAALVELFESFKAALTREYGAAERVAAGSGAAHGYAPDTRERTIQWRRPAHRLVLSLGREEFGWTVQMDAISGVPQH